MIGRPAFPQKETLRIIPFYTGVETLESALQHPKSLQMLWLEILLNGTIPWENYLDRREIRASYEKACVWYGCFKTMIEGHIRRGSLPAKRGEIDQREYRKFLEALNFVSDRT